MADVSEALIAQGWTLHNGIGFSETVGPIWGRQEGDVIAFGVLAAEKHMNGLGAMHGGMLATLADNILGRTAFDSVRPQVAVTIQLNLHYVSGVKLGEFVEGRARMVRATRSIIFMEGELRVGERVVARADGIWKIIEGATRPVAPAVADKSRW